MAVFTAGESVPTWNLPVSMLTRPREARTHARVVLDSIYRFSTKSGLEIRNLIGSRKKRGRGNRKRIANIDDERVEVFLAAFLHEYDDTLAPGTFTPQTYTPEMLAWGHAQIGVALDEWTSGRYTPLTSRVIISQYPLYLHEVMSSFDDTDTGPVVQEMCRAWWAKAVAYDLQSPPTSEEIGIT
ncbi:hypothetical protein GALMADRAFT_215517 [Galerina marginata CBS 339.88]|uniref:Uncharacterized protein n=1 Tax=Galerina marginata (strain CBS 339.88) TaxID=685588 RepID=A0A067SQD5_GALM3|nr:hypothetical protein GALMADRAFT_215517 [Galerina marginata CBS 339.88]